jgi:hypothetical protein
LVEDEWGEEGIEDDWSLDFNVGPLPIK